MSWGMCEDCEVIGNVYCLQYTNALGERKLSVPLCMDCRRMERAYLKVTEATNIVAVDKVA